MKSDQHDTRMRGEDLNRWKGAAELVDSLYHRNCVNSPRMIVRMAICRRTSVPFASSHDIEAYNVNFSAFYVL